VAGFVSAAPDEEKLGKSEGYPLCPLVSTIPVEEKCLVGMLSHFDTLVPARKVDKGATVFELKRPASEQKITYKYQDKSGDTDSYQEHSRNTGLLVLKGDQIVVERYQYDRKPTDKMQSYSMAKTVVAMLVGIAIAEKKIRSIEDTADQYVPELKGHPYGGTKLKDLLTMSSGVKFSENYDGKDDVSVLARNTIYGLGPGGVDTVKPFTERANPPGRSSTTLRPRRRCSGSCCGLRRDTPSPNTSRTRSGGRWAPSPTRAGSSMPAATSSASWESTHAARLGPARHAAREPGQPQRQADHPGRVGQGRDRRCIRRTSRRHRDEIQRLRLPDLADRQRGALRAVRRSRPGRVRRSENESRRRHDGGA
jgi:hypothetical protein